jgi:hypothetical protein
LLVGKFIFGSYFVFSLLLPDHLRPTFGTGTVNAALTGYMRFFMPALGVRANTVAAWAGAGFVAATLTTLATKISVYHRYISLSRHWVHGTFIQLILCAALL